MNTGLKKLLKLKGWLTVPDAAHHLSILFGEDVTEADVLRFALDGHLALSVRFVNKAFARCGQESSYTAEVENSNQEVQKTGGIKPTTFGIVSWCASVDYIDGIWDLIIAGTGRTHVEQTYQRLISGPIIQTRRPGGPLLHRPDAS